MYLYSKPKIHSILNTNQSVYWCSDTISNEFNQSMAQMFVSICNICFEGKVTDTFLTYYYTLHCDFETVCSIGQDQEDDEDWVRLKASRLPGVKDHTLISGKNMYHNVFIWNAHTHTCTLTLLFMLNLSWGTILLNIWLCHTFGILL